MTLRIYGIKNCDTVKSARRFLDGAEHPYTFIDLQKEKLPDDLLKSWLTQFPDTLINKRSTTYRAIKSDWLAAKDSLEKQVAIIQHYPTVMKRPILLTANETVIIGFVKEAYLDLIR